MVSVIMPVYNAQDYMSETIESVLRQTYSDIELIIVNDGSSDDSERIAKSYESDSRVKVINQANSGVSVARNNGFANSIGEYILFVDADDILADDMVYTLVNTIETHHADVVSCGAGIVENGVVVREEFGTGQLKSYNRIDAMKYYLIGNDVNIGVWTKLFTRESVKDVEYKKGVRINEDKLYIFEALMHSNVYVVNDVTKYYYVKRDNSATTKKFNERWFDSLDVADAMYELTVKEDESLELYGRINRVKSYYWVLLMFCKNPGIIQEYFEQYNRIVRRIKSEARFDTIKFLPRNMIINIFLLKVSEGLFRKLKVR